MSNDIASFFGPNAGYVLDLYDRYRRDPQTVDADTRALFQQWTPNGVAGAVVTDNRFDVTKVVRAARVARLVRELGHLDARIDPLGSEPPSDPGLKLETHGVTADDLASLPPTAVEGKISVGAANALEAVGRLRRAYSGSIGYEDAHVQVDVEREWLREAAESGRFLAMFDDEAKRDILWRLTHVETFEKYLHQTFTGQKRFSIEGTDMLVPMLHSIIADAASSGMREVLMGMAHRGRLNVLAHILKKPYAAILAEFQSSKDEKSSVSGGGSRGWSGDVKYHLGAGRAYSGESDIYVSLASNPSHLEFVNPVVLGRARAAQDSRHRPGLPRQHVDASLAVLIHGDAAFPGQGVVAETLNLQGLPGYRIGGTIHIIANNQIGFTTGPTDSRSTVYASDLAKGFEIPIVHVNADDAIACMATARMAFEYREKFHKDFLIDLVGYRRWGHNEGDEPAFTQPRMYEVVSKHPTVREIWAADLERQQVVTRDEADSMVKHVWDRLQDARANPPMPLPEPLVIPSVTPQDVRTAVSEARLLELNEALLYRPEGFTANAKLDRNFLRRRALINEPGGIDWAHAESLAFASILEDSTPIRFTGQDTERGTFSQRHLVLYDPTTGDPYTPLQTLPQANASFAVYNSPLSEVAVLGFEYGYSRHAREALVLWEAQFGDFSNAAQVIIDQFLVSGRAKWKQKPSLVMLLPHGYEGQGPEHSSGRVERYLQLAADDNIRIANCTTSAQYFHLLRRQAALLEAAPRPLIVMTPKSLLRHPRAGSSLEDFTSGRFHPVLDDERARRNPENVTRVVLSTGKVYVDLVGSTQFSETDSVAAVRVEELYPFPAAELTDVLAGYPNMREVVWLQEEPKNMGAWTFIAPRLAGMLERGIKLSYVGRPESASPAEGSMRRHVNEQSRLLSEALMGMPEPRVKRSKLTHAR